MNVIIIDEIRYVLLEEAEQAIAKAKDFEKQTVRTLGYIEGFKEGALRSIDVTLREKYYEGYYQGRDIGQKDGRRQGYEIGYKQGYDEGKEQAMIDYEGMED